MISVDTRGLVLATVLAIILAVCSASAGFSAAIVWQAERCAEYARAAAECTETLGRAADVVRSCVCAVSGRCDER